MKPFSFVLAIIASSLLAGTLNGCSTSTQHRSQSPSGPIRGPGASAGGSGSAGATGSGSGAGSEQMGSGMIVDQAAMCELNRRISSAAPQERQAMLEQYMPGMSPDMREQHLAMMRARCQ
jgi:hypothetical protein